MQTENQRKMVCSAYVTYVLECAGVLRGINYSKVTPQDVAEMRIYRECAQILGAPVVVVSFRRNFSFLP